MPYVSRNTRHIFLLSVYTSNTAELFNIFFYNPKSTSWSGGGMWCDVWEQIPFKTNYYLIFKELLESPHKLQLFCGLQTCESFLLERGYDGPGGENFLGIIFQESKDLKKEEGQGGLWPSPSSPLLQPMRSNSSLFLLSLQKVLQAQPDSTQNGACLGNAGIGRTCPGQIWGQGHGLGQWWQHLGKVGVVPGCWLLPRLPSATFSWVCVEYVTKHMFHKKSQNTQKQEHLKKIENFLLSTMLHRTSRYRGQLFFFSFCSFIHWFNHSWL